MKPHVGWDEVRDYCRLSTDTLHGMYKYACNMAHPSYLGLIQFHDAYKEGAIESLNETLDGINKVIEENIKEDIHPVVNSRYKKDV